MDVGSELAEARRRLTLSVADVAHRTKIRETTIRAIERNDSNGLPGGIYIRGFLRAYAREVGCDPEHIVDRYKSQSGAPQGDSHEVPGIVTTILRAREESHVDCEEIAALDRRRNRAETIAVAGLLFGGILYVVLNRSVDPAEVVSDPSALISPAQVPPVAEAVRPVEQPSIALRLNIQSRGLSWLTATADGQRVSYRLLNAGEDTSIEAREEVVLRIGDPGSVGLTVNGVPAPPLGIAGRAVTIHLTPQNYLSFLGH